MDLALLVYSISLLGGIGKFFFFMLVLAILVAIGNFFYWVDGYDKERDAGVRDRLWKCFWVGIAASWGLILLPSEKTAYTMVGAYAAQKVAENDKVQQMSGKVLTIIEQKLDDIIDEGIDEAKKKLEKKEKDGKR